MSLAAFPIQTSDMPRCPLQEQHSQAHGNAVFREKPLKNNARRGVWKKSLWKTTHESMVPFPNIPCRPSEWATNFKNNPYRPSEWATNFENIPCRPSEWASNFESNPYRPSEWATNFENNPCRPSEWVSNFENTFTDGTEAGFSRKTTKTIPAFRLRFIPARYAIKSRLPGNAFHSSLPLHKRPIGV